VKALRQAVGQLAIANEERSKAPVFDERMIQRKDDRVIVDHMKRVTQLRIHTKETTLRIIDPDR